ncbi:calcium-binding protein [Thalassotalea ganghwensis]
MNKKVLLLSIITSVVASFFGATYLYLPHVSIPDYDFTINESDFRDVTLPLIDCSALKKTSFLNKLNVIDTSDKKKSAYINLEVPDNQSSELHVFGTYSGTPIVHVDKTEKPTTLVLSSGESTIWSVQLEAGAFVNKIYAFKGVKEVRVSKKASQNTSSKLKYIFSNKNPLDDLEVIKVNSKNTCRKYGYKWSPDENGKFRYFINTVRHNTQQMEKSFQGLYSFNSSHLPFVVPMKTNFIQKESSIEINKTAINSKDYPETITDADKLIVFIEELIATNTIPASVASIEHGSEGRLMRFSPPYTRTLPKRKVNAHGDYNCKRDGSVLIVGDDKPNVINCARGDQVYYAGGGRDLIEDSWGNDIFYGGKGNDVIDAGWGSDILIFNEGWGEDIVDKTCHNSIYRKSNTIGASEHDYHWKYTNFIVFGPNIRSTDMVWNNDKMTNTITGDTITFKSKCFNFVYFTNK